MNKIALRISNRGNDWTAKSAMIASNEKGYKISTKMPGKSNCRECQNKPQEILAVYKSENKNKFWDSRSGRYIWKKLKP